MTVAGLMFLAIVSYTSADPSANTATHALKASNLLGHKGAYFADMMVQWFGLAAFLPVIILAAWGLRVILARPLGAIGWRMAGAMSVMFFATATLAGFPDLGAWPFGLLSGGATGLLTLDFISSLMPQTWLDFNPHWAAAVSAVFALVIFFPVLGFSYGEWGRVLHRSAQLTYTALMLLGSSLVWGYHRLRHPQERRPLLVSRISEQENFYDEQEPEEDDVRDDEIEESFAQAARSSDAVTVQSKKARIKAQKGNNKVRRVAMMDGESYEFPPLDLLALPPEGSHQKQSAQQLDETAESLMSALNDYGVEGKILKASPGPVVTLYELEPAPGTKSARVIGLSDDIARQMSAISVRVSTVPGRNVLGIELPNTKRETVYLRELLSHASYSRTAAKLPLSLGKDISGEPVIVDLARMPHLLVAGTTGSGKSVSVNAMILSLLYRMTPEQVRLIMIDPKMLELSIYEGIPHLLSPVVTDPKKAVLALKWAVREMEDRYRAMSKLGVRNVDGYNERIKIARDKGEVLSRRIQTGFDADTGKPVFEDQPIDLVEMPYIVVIVDEMADLMLVAGKDIEAAIQRLAQMARAAGIHLIMATQRPSVDVITGTIKANFPTRISFQVTSRIDSRTILNEQGAEQLLGQGDMLYMAGGGRVTRVHGAFASDHEVEEVVRHLRAQGEPVYVDDVTVDADGGDAVFGLSGDDGSGDELYDRAVQIVLRERKASTSYIQRCLQIGYNRAARLIERMEAEGLVSAANHVGKREILVPGESAR